MKNRNFLVTDEYKTYEEKGVKITFKNPSKLALIIIFPDKHYKETDRKRCDIFCLIPNNFQYYIELKKTYRSEAVRQLMDTIEDFSKEFPVGSKAKEAYVVYTKQMHPAAATSIQQAKNEFTERLNMVVKDVKSPFCLPVQ